MTVKAQSITYKNDNYPSFDVLKLGAFQTYILYFLQHKPMPQLTIPYDKYVLTLDYEAPQLQFQLTPDQFSSQPSFTYVSKLHPQNMDNLLKLLFSSVENLWTYLNFYKEKALSIDSGRIEADNKELSRDGQQKGVDLPISVKLIMLEGIGTVVKLKGDMLLESPEKRLAKSNEEIKRLKDQVQELKQELASNQAKLSQFHELQEENAELKLKLEHYERGRFRSTDEVPPKKRIHLSQDHPQESKQAKPSNIPSNYGQTSMIPETTQRHKAPQPTKETLNVSQESSPSQSKSSELDDKNDSFGSNSSSRKSKKSRRIQPPSEQSKITEQENAKKLPEPSRKENETNDYADKSFDEDFFEMNSYSMVNENSFGKKPTAMANHREKLQESDQAKLIESFAAKCLTEVGYTDRGDAKTGYVCVFCEKIFKQPEFLNKHIFTRHQEVLESHANETYLMGKLNTYKLGRDATLQAQARNKKIEKLKNSFMENNR